MITSTEDEKVLVQKLIYGEELAFKLLYNKYKNKLYTFCLRLTKSEEYAEELVQDVFLKIWLERKKINPSFTFSAYLFKITKNASLNFLKKASVDLKLQKNYITHIESTYTVIENTLNHYECEYLFEKAIQILPPQQKMVFKMSRIDGMTHKQIAEALSLSQGTVKNYMTIALSNIKKYLIINSDKIMLILLIFVIFFI